MKNLESINTNRMGGAFNVNINYTPFFGAAGFFPKVFFLGGAFFSSSMKSGGSLSLSEPAVYKNRVYATERKKHKGWEMQPQLLALSIVKLTYWPLLLLGAAKISSLSSSEGGNTRLYLEREKSYIGNTARQTSFPDQSHGR